MHVRFSACDDDSNGLQGLQHNSVYTTAFNITSRKRFYTVWRIDNCVYQTNRFADVTTCLLTHALVVVNDFEAKNIFNREEASRRRQSRAVKIINIRISLESVILYSEKINKNVETR